MRTDSVAQRAGAAVALVVAVLLLAGCLARTTPVPSSATSIPPTATPVPPTTTRECVDYLMMDMAGGAAYLDANANGALDPSDPPLSGAMLVLEYSDGTEKREATDYTGQVRVGVTERWSDDPSCKTSERRLVATRMEPPPGFILLRVEQAGHLFAPSPEQLAEATRRAADEETTRALEATRIAKSNETLTREFAGAYLRASRRGEFRLTIAPPGTYASANTEASGRERLDHGTLVIGTQRFWLDKQGLDSAALIPVLWGERRYLVEAGALPRFCAPDSGEPRSTREGYFYLREGDWARPAEGVPMLLDGTPACRDG
jgi:hypothetical protein